MAVCVPVCPSASLIIFMTFQYWYYRKKSHFGSGHVLITLATLRLWLLLLLKKLLLLLLQHPFNGLSSKTTCVSRHQTVNHSGFYWSKRWWGGSGISWTICKSFAPRSRQITMPVPHHSVFTGCMPFLLPNQWRQSTEDNTIKVILTLITHHMRGNLSGNHRIQ